MMENKEFPIISLAEAKERLKGSNELCDDPWGSMYDIVHE